MATYTPITSTSQIPIFPTDIIFRVYYLEAPLSILAESIGGGIGNNLIGVNGFHTGLGFQAFDTDNKTYLPQYNFTLDLTVAAGFAVSSLLPTIVETPNGRDLRWDNQNQINLGSEIDQMYWTKSTYLLDATSLQTEELFKWILGTWMPNNPYYALFSSSASALKSDIFNPRMRACICDTFVYNCIGYMTSTDRGKLLTPIDPLPGLNIPNRAVTDPNVTVSAFIGSSSDITVVNYSSERESIISFFSNFESSLEREFSLLSKLRNLARSLVSQQPPNYQNLLRHLQNELYSIYLVAQRELCKLGEAYYYSYDSSDGQIKYWRIVRPEVYLAYLNSEDTINYFETINTLASTTSLTSLSRGCRVNTTKQDLSQPNLWKIAIALGILLAFSIILFKRH